MTDPIHRAEPQPKSMLIGFIGILIFSLSLPFTRLATGTPEDPQLGGFFISFSRASIAGVLSAAYLLAVKANIPTGTQFRLLAATSAGIVFGFPILLSLGLRYIESVKASIILGALPLTTAIFGSLINRQKPSLLFWLAAVSGFLLIALYVIIENSHLSLRIHFADAMIFGAVLFAAMGYAVGAKLSATLNPQNVICWALVIALPFNLIGSWATFPQIAIRTASWFGLAYLGVFSMWLGFFFWYRALQSGGTVKISQIQLFQPFFSVIFSALILGESISPFLFITLAGVTLSVVIGKKAGLQNKTG